MSKTIGFIGTGIMGAPMAANLLRAGHQLRVYNRTASKADALVEMGALRAESPAEAASGADILICIVSRTDDVREVLLGSIDEQGQGAAIDGLSEGAIVIDMSTIDSDATREMACVFAEKNIAFIDAPVSGGEKGAIEASLTVFVGGDEQAFQNVEPVLSTLGHRVTYMGASGAGQVAKACNQILVSVAVMATAEALNFGRSEGLDLSQLIVALSGGSAQSWILENLGSAMAAGNFEPGFMVDLMQKDLEMLLGNASEKELPAPAAQLASHLFSALQAEGRGSEGMQTMYKAYRGMDAASEEGEEITESAESAGVAN